jgi:hypothetical protein
MLFISKVNGEIISFLHQLFQYLATLFAQIALELQLNAFFLHYYYFVFEFVLLIQQDGDALG